MIKEQKIEGVGLLKGVVNLTKEVLMEQTEAQKALAKMIPLSSPKELPKDFSENCQYIWEAFNVGREYERLLKEEEAGAGMMGFTGFDSACFYRYARIDWKQLLTNLDGDLELARNNNKKHSLCSCVGRIVRMDSQMVDK